MTYRLPLAVVTNRLTRIAWQQKEVLRSILIDLDLEASLPKCNNFRIEAFAAAYGNLSSKVYKKPNNRRIREGKRRGMLRAVERLEDEEGMGISSELLLYKWECRCKLLGVALDCH